MAVTKVMMIAGEASGDLHGAGVVRELRKRNPSIDIFGVGGDRMKQEGMNVVYHVRELGFMGFIEVVKHLPFIKVMEYTLGQIVRFKKPDVLVLIDYPGFNLRFARKIRQAGMKIVYYISPQVWAWHSSRVKRIRELVDQMLVVFPFEVPWYEKEGVPVRFVGHPLLEVLETNFSRRNFCKRYDIDPDKQILALLPGSRRQEIERILPVMLQAAKRVARERGMEVVLGVAPTLDPEYLRTMYDVAGVRLVEGATYDVMAHAAFAMVTSGTATLETACFGTPMMVVYKTSWMTYIIGRLLVRVKAIGLVNIVAGGKIVPEFIQHRATPSAMAAEALSILGDSEKLTAMRGALMALKQKLGSPGASARVADHILRMA